MRALSREHEILNTLGPGHGIRVRKQMSVTYGRGGWRNIINGYYTVDQLNIDLFQKCALTTEYLSQSE